MLLGSANSTALSKNKPLVALVDQRKAQGAVQAWLGSLLAWLGAACSARAAAAALRCTACSQSGVATLTRWRPRLAGAPEHLALAALEELHNACRKRSAEEKTGSKFTLAMVRVLSRCAAAWPRCALLPLCFGASRRNLPWT